MAGIAELPAPIQGVIDLIPTIQTRPFLYMMEVEMRNTLDDEYLQVVLDAIEERRKDMPAYCCQDCETCLNHNPEDGCVNDDY